MPRTEGDEGTDPQQVLMDVRPGSGDVVEVERTAVSGVVPEHGHGEGGLPHEPEQDAMLMPESLLPV